MQPASMEEMVEASSPPKPQAQRWPGEAGDAPEDDPDYEAIQSGVFDMSPEELDALQKMIDEARARMEKARPDPGGKVVL